MRACVHGDHDYMTRRGGSGGTIFRSLDVIRKGDEGPRSCARSARSVLKDNGPRVGWDWRRAECRDTIGPPAVGGPIGAPGMGPHQSWVMFPRGNPFEYSIDYSELTQATF